MRLDFIFKLARIKILYVANFIMARKSCLLLSYYNGSQSSNIIHRIWLATWPYFNVNHGSQKTCDFIQVLARMLFLNINANVARIIFNGSHNMHELNIYNGSQCSDIMITIILARKFLSNSTNILAHNFIIDLYY